VTLLPVLIAVLTIVAVPSAIILVRAAVRRPRVGALMERATAAVVIAAFGVVYTIVAFDTELGRPILDLDGARLVVRLGVVALLCVPVWWTALYLAGKLGSDE